ncbi:hypothetical protein HYH03_006736 [Edaphochlamys debaryana]|uniref:Fungal lipase-type domain-containing protein n=1 Tax=Edaphochlamys debaryana TaxID=47281 RepID=A0A835Y6L4_9CHLO|nr:hypothetical protein HYH03_006736 [Edaphochlamys debaryana]|eukprot:KAG2495126.1 hypothetical protein HYH03_006736 [Edaphochlamys debaryana]
MTQLQTQASLETRTSLTHASAPAILPTRRVASRVPKHLVIKGAETPATSALLTSAASFLKHGISGSGVAVKESSEPEVLARARLLSRVAFRAYGSPDVWELPLDAPFRVVGSEFDEDDSPYHACAWINDEAGAEGLVAPSRMLRRMQSVHRTDTQALVLRNPSELEVVVAFRGTQVDIKNHPMDPLKDLDAALVSLREDVFGAAPHLRFGSEQPKAEPRAHRGFVSCYTAVHQAVRQAVAEALEQFPAEQRPRVRLVLTGHSLGGALATLAAYDLANIYQNAAQDRVVCYTFGAPRVCNGPLARVYDQLVPNTWRFSNVNDVVPMVPLVHWSYCHVGRNVRIVNATRRLVRFVDRAEQNNAFRMVSALLTLTRASCYYFGFRLGRLAVRLLPRWLRRGGADKKEAKGEGKGEDKGLASVFERISAEHSSKVYTRI